MHVAMKKEDPIKPSISFGYAVKELIDQDIMRVYKVAEDKMYNNKLHESKNTRRSIISSLMNILDERSHRKEVHYNRLKEMCEEIGKELELPIDQIEDLKLLLLFRDIGITAIPDYIFDENINISLEEDNIIKNHCEIGYRIANSLFDIAHISQDILSHHEKWDGSGYPQGLSREEIPLNSRIISVLDVYEVMINKNEPLPRNEVLEFIKNNSGIYFDPKIVEVFLNILKK